MQPDQLQQRLHPELQKQKQFKEKIDKYGLAIRVGLATLGIILFFVAFAIIQAPKKVEGPATACFKHDMCFNLEIARTPAELETGLSNHTSIAADYAMLFVFEKIDIQRMWMKDMKYPIDLFWLDKNGRVTHIVKNAEPCEPGNCEIYEPSIPAKYVIETRAGFAKENNQFDGDTVELKNIPEY
jgi:uncharacterized membrane protein (UPF0127 family)